MSRGDVLVTPDAWFSTAVVDVAGTDEVDFTTMAQQFSVHIGTATVYAHCRPLGPNFARLTLDRTCHYILAIVSCCVAPVSI